MPTREALIVDKEINSVMAIAFLLIIKETQKNNCEISGSTIQTDGNKCDIEFNIKAPID